jgi:Tfp pilus assembly protein PilV
VRSGSHNLRRGFTLMEALMASGILLAVVIAVTSAITAGQQNAYEAHQRIAATLATEDLLGRLLVENYANLPTWSGYSEAVGEMTDGSGNPMPSSFDMIGRDVQVTTDLKTVSALAVNVRGRTVRVRAFDADARILAELSRFIPEPPE